MMSRTLRIQMIRSSKNRCRFDSDGFEATLMTLTQDAIAKLQIEFAAQNERVFQVAIWTDIDARVSAISIETKENADRKRNAGAAYWRAHGDDATAKEIEAAEFNGNPADFKYHAYATVHHSQSDMPDPISKMAIPI